MRSVVFFITYITITVSISTLITFCISQTPQQRVVRRNFSTVAGLEQTTSNDHNNTTGIKLSTELVDTKSRVNLSSSEMILKTGNSNSVSANILRPIDPKTPAITHIFAVNPCRHDGRLVFSSSSSHCLCKPGFKGNVCQEMVCNKCDQNAKCVSGQCACNKHYVGSGIFCRLLPQSVVYSPCSTHPCLNHGICIDLDERRYDCRCVTGYSGVNCEKKLRCVPTNPCKNGGVCFESGLSFRCVCPIKYTGKDCSNSNIQQRLAMVNFLLLKTSLFNRTMQRLQYCIFYLLVVVLQDKCNPNPCRIGGICKTSEDSLSAYCVCPSYKFIPPLCDCNCPKANIGKQKHSVDSFCNIKGDCLCPQTNMYLTPYGCVSAVVMDNPCSSHPCQNNGTCYNSTTLVVTQNDQSYGCRCQSGFTGIRCHIKLPDPCTNNPCQNNGTCSAVNGVAVCNCKSGFVPPFCNTPALGFSVCVPNPCLNYGECVERNNGYECKCKDGFSGSHCHVTVDNCHGRCNYTTMHCLHGKCVCNPGFVGDGKYCVPILKGSIVPHRLVINVKRSKLLFKSKQLKDHTTSSDQDKKLPSVVNNL